MKYQKWLDKNVDDLNGKTIIVTGANSGIGYYSTLCFLYKGAHVIMACRNLDKANKAKENLLETSVELIRRMEKDYENILNKGIKKNLK